MFASRLPSAILRQMNAVAPFRPSAKCRPSPSNIMMHNRQNYISISALDTRVRHVYAYPTVRQFSSNESVTITYVDSNGDEHPVIAEVGHHLLDVAHNNNIELEGACGGELACSTCHLIFDQDVYDSLPPKSDEEEDMLDLAFELTETSRLGCQIRVTKELDGIKVRIPDDGY